MAPPSNTRTNQGRLTYLKGMLDQRNDISFEQTQALEGMLKAYREFLVSQQRNSISNIYFRPEVNKVIYNGDVNVTVNNNPSSNPSSNPTTNFVRKAVAPILNEGPSLMHDVLSARKINMDDVKALTNVFQGTTNVVKSPTANNIRQLHSTIKPMKEMRNRAQGARRSFGKFLLGIAAVVTVAAVAFAATVLTGGIAGLAATPLVIAACAKVGLLGTAVAASANKLHMRGQEDSVSQQIVIDAIDRVEKEVPRTLDKIEREQPKQGVAEKREKEVAVEKDVQVEQEVSSRKRM